MNVKGEGILNIVQGGSKTDFNERGGGSGGILGIEVKYICTYMKILVPKTLIQL